MSVHKTATGTWRVKWRESGQQRSRGGFARRADAQRFDAEVTRLRQLGPLGLPQLEKGAVTVDEFVAGPFAERVETLAPKTRQRYAETYRLHVAPYLGDTPLHDVTVELLTGWQARLLRAGVGVETVRRANTLIGSILQRAVEFGRGRGTRPQADAKFFAGGMQLFDAPGQRLRHRLGVARAGKAAHADMGTRRNQGGGGIGRHDFGVQVKVLDAFDEGHQG